VTDLLSSAVYNLDADVEQGEGRFQRQLVYKNVPNNVADEFQKLSSKKAQTLLEELNAWLAEKTKVDSTHSNTEDTKQTATQNNSNKKRVGLGLYYFENDAD